MTTNAVLLDKYMDFLVENNFSLLISLDGNEFNQSYRVDKVGKNSFDKVAANADLLREKYPYFFLENVNFNAVLHNRNSVAETHDFIQSTFGKKPRLVEVNTSGIRPEKHKEFWATYKNKLESLHEAENYTELSEELFLESVETLRLALFIHNYSGNVFNTYNDLLVDKNLLRKTPTGTCLPFGKKVFVTVNGKILPCERIGHNYKLGRISTNEVLIDFEEIAINYNNWYQKFENQCSKCFIKACTKCMFNISDLDESPICDQYANQETFEKYVQDNMNYLRNNPNLYKRIIDEVIITN